MSIVTFDTALASTITLCAATILPPLAIVIVLVAWEITASTGRSSSSTPRILDEASCCSKMLSSPCAVMALVDARRLPFSSTAISGTSSGRIEVTTCLTATLSASLSAVRTSLSLSVMMVAVSESMVYSASFEVEPITLMVWPALNPSDVQLPAERVIVCLEPAGAAKVSFGSPVIAAELVPFSKPASPPWKISNLVNCAVVALADSETFCALSVAAPILMVPVAFSSL